MTQNTENISKIFNSFCDKVLQIYKDDESISSIVSSVQSLSNDEKIILVNHFIKSLDAIPEGYSLLENKKTKLFSSKEEETYALSCSLFGKDVTLKKIFNNLEGKERDYLWLSLKVLVDSVNIKRTKKVKNSILNLDVDENTNGMIEDIVTEFKSAMNTSDGSQANPLAAIMGVTNTITSKYKSKLESGEIQLDSLMEDLTSKMPGVKNMMEQMAGGTEGGGLGGLASIMGGMGDKPKKDTVIMDENFSTADVILGDDKEKDSNIDLTKMLPVAKSVFGGKPKKDDSKADLEGSLEGSLESMLKSLGGTEGFNLSSLLDNKDPEKAKEMKENMDKIMKDKFNIDMSVLDLGAKDTTDDATDDATDTTKKESNKKSL